MTLVAKDGYGMTLSYEQIVDHTFTTYDPATGDEEPAADDLTVIVAYERDGEPLGQDEGPLRLMVAPPNPGAARRRSLDGEVARRVSVTKASAEWTVKLQGAAPTPWTSLLHVVLLARLSRQGLGGRRHALAGHPALASPA